MLMVMQVKGVRIFTPGEYEKLEDQVSKPSLRKLIGVMLLTGMRYEEVLSLKKTPENFMKNDSCIWVRSGKKKVVSHERYVPLTPRGIETTMAFLEDEREVYPPANVIMLNLVSWSEKAGLEPLPEDQMRDMAGANTGRERKNVYGISVKSFRKTWENWLIDSYPERVLQILKAQGHNAATALEHYAGANFSSSDLEAIRAYTSGWKA